MLQFFLGMISLFLLGSSRKSCTAFSFSSSRQFSSITFKDSCHHSSTCIFNVNPTKEEINDTNQKNESIKAEEQPVPVHRAEGLCAVYKPLDWTSNDVVSYIRGMLERDARNRGAKLAKRKSRSKTKKIKVGHGGTLDPLATGVLVLGIGSGTKDLQSYLSGSKRYSADVELGFETATLDMEQGKENATKTAPFDHVTDEMIEGIIPQFNGNIMQKPPLYSAIRKNGKRLYEQARAGMTEDDIEIEAREVTVYNLDYLREDSNGRTLPSFGIDVECGGGTYIRSLIRDMGYALDTCATMTSLERTQQGQFTLEDAMLRDDWSADNIYAAVEKSNTMFDVLKGSEKIEDDVSTKN